MAEANAVPEHAPVLPPAAATSRRRPLLIGVAVVAVLGLAVAAVLIIGGPPSLSAAFVLSGHSRQVLAAVYSPDGTLVATAGADKTIKVWDSATGTLRHTLTGHGAEVSAVRFVPASHALLSGDADGNVMMWDADTGQPVASRYKLDSGVISLAINQSPAGLVVLAGCLDKKVIAMSAGGTKVVTTTNADPWNVLFTPDAAFGIVGSDDGNVRVFVDFQPDPVKSASAVSAQLVSLRVIGDRTLLGYGSDGIIEMTIPDLAVTSRRLLKPAPDVAGFSGDGRLVAGGFEDGTVRLWDARTGAQLARLKGHSGRLSSLAFSPDGTKLATSSFDGSARLWHLPTTGAAAAASPGPSGLGGASAGTATHSPSSSPPVQARPDQPASLPSPVQPAPSPVPAGASAELAALRASLASEQQSRRSAEELVRTLRESLDAMTRSSGSDTAPAQALRQEVVSLRDALEAERRAKSMSSEELKRVRAQLGHLTGNNQLVLKNTGQRFFLECALVLRRDESGNLLVVGHSFVEDNNGWNIEPGGTFNLGEGVAAVIHAEMIGNPARVSTTWSVNPPGTPGIINIALKWD